MAIKYLHVEFISRPIDRQMFMLLLEKSVIVERYREMMKYISREAGTRIEAYENLMDINRKDLFVTENEKNIFKNILVYEKNLLKRQEKLNNAIKEFALLRQKDMFDIKNRVRVEGMLSELRKQELLDANSIITAQETVIDYSTRKLQDAEEIIGATEKVAELGRHEAMQLHEQLEKERVANKEMHNTIEKLRNELKTVKKK